MKFQSDFLNKLGIHFSLPFHINKLLWVECVLSQELEMYPAHYRLQNNESSLCRQLQAYLHPSNYPQNLRADQ